MDEKEQYDETVNMSEDITTLLNYLLGFADGLQDKEAGKSLRRMVKNWTTDFLTNKRGS